MLSAKWSQETCLIAGNRNIVGNPDGFQISHFPNKSNCITTEDVSLYVKMKKLLSFLNETLSACLSISNQEEFMHRVLIKIPPTKQLAV
jgi:hypothetical protein